MFFYMFDQQLIGLVKTIQENFRKIIWQKHVLTN